MAKTRVVLFGHLCLTTSDMPQMQTRLIMRQSALLLSPCYQTLYGTFATAIMAEKRH